MCAVRVYMYIHMAVIRLQRRWRRPDTSHGENMSDVSMRMYHWYRRSRWSHTKFKRTEPKCGTARRRFGGAKVCQCAECCCDEGDGLWGCCVVTFDVLNRFLNNFFISLLHWACNPIASGLPLLIGCASTKLTEQIRAGKLSTEIWLLIYISLMNLTV